MHVGFWTDIGLHFGSNSNLSKMDPANDVIYICKCKIVRLSYVRFLVFAHIMLYIFLLFSPLKVAFDLKFSYIFRSVLWYTSFEMQIRKNIYICFCIYETDYSIFFYSKQCFTNNFTNAPLVVLFTIELNTFLVWMVFQAKFCFLFLHTFSYILYRESPCVLQHFLLAFFRVCVCVVCERYNVIHFISSSYWDESSNNNQQSNKWKMNPRAHSKNTKQNQMKQNETKISSS